jgi:uncharacterized protein (TIGR02996 family)
MTATESDIAALLAAVEADPLDTAPRLILADAVEEMGRPDLAELLRTREPLLSSDDAGWWRDWGREDIYRVHPESDLPGEVFDRLEGGTVIYEDMMAYDGEADARTALARAVVRAAKEARP